MAIDSPQTAPIAVLLHSSGSSARQWDRLAQQLGPRLRVVAPDFRGHGAAPAGAPPTLPTLADEVGRIEQLIDGLRRRAPAPIHLIGHSFGGAVALTLALRRPQAYASLSVYEPVLFSVPYLHDRQALPVQRTLAAAEHMRCAVRLGWLDQAAEAFVDFWSGAGAWAALPAARRQSVAARMPAVVSHFDMLFGAGIAAADLAAIQAPVLLLSGGRSPPIAALTAHLVAAGLPTVEQVTIDAAGHMGPVSHAEAVNARIVAFVDAMAPAVVPLAAAA